MSSRKKIIKSRKSNIERIGIDSLKIKHLYSQQTVNPFETMNNQFLNMCREWSRSPMLEFFRQMEEQNKLLKESLKLSMTPQLDAISELYKGIKPFAEQISKMHSPLLSVSETLRQQFMPFQDVLKQFNTVHEYAFRGIVDTIRNIPRESLLSVRLHSKYWLIVDTALLSSIIENKLDEETEVIPYVMRYYKEDSWKRFELLVGTWSTHISEERIKVFKAAILVAKKSNEEEVHLMTIPALIAQIDGLVRDLYSVLPKTTRKRVEKQIEKDLVPDLKGKRPDIRKDVAVQTVAEIVDFWSAEILQEIIFSGLFRDSREIKPEGSFSLFRHKIMHGDKEYLKCQNEESFVQLMLYTDFIVNLIKQIKDGSIIVEQKSQQKEVSHVTN